MCTNYVMPIAINKKTIRTSINYGYYFSIWNIRIWKICSFL